MQRFALHWKIGYHQSRRIIRPCMRMLRHGWPGKFCNGAGVRRERARVGSLLSNCATTVTDRGKKCYRTVTESEGARKSRSIEMERMELESKSAIVSLSVEARRSNQKLFPHCVWLGWDYKMTLVAFNSGDSEMLSVRGFRNVDL